MFSFFHKVAIERSHIAFNIFLNDLFIYILKKKKIKQKFSELQPYGNCIIIPYIGKDLYRFAKQISALISNPFNPKVLLIFKTFKVKNYFLLKSRTPKALCSNVIYQFTGLCDTNMTYFGMSSRYLIKRVREHLNFKSIQKSAIKKSYFVM